MDVVLREVVDSDIDVFWAHARDPESRRVTAITRPWHYDRAAFDAHWSRTRSMADVVQRTVLVDGAVAGSIAVFGPPDEREVTYAVGPAFWGRGVATAALRRMLELEPTRPLFAGAAADNVGSLRVLERCGFVVTGSARDASLDRGGEVDVVLLTLHDDAAGTST